MDMQQIGQLIMTQDNRCTSDPIFIVQSRRRIYGMDPEYGGYVVWVDSEGDPADEKELREIHAMEDAGEDVSHWTKTAYVDIWIFVTACFTEQGCQDYIAANGHNLTEPRIYAASAYRNAEFIAVRKFLAEQAG